MINKKEIGVDEKLTVGQSLFYGVQSVISLNLFLGAIIIAGMLQMDIVHTAILITLSFLASGIATLIQAGFFMKYPVIQGISYAVMAGLAAVAYAHDMATAFGSLILGAVILIVVGQLGLFSKIMKIIPPIVAGVVIILIGINVIFTAISNLISSPGDMKTNFLLGFIAFGLIFLFKALGNTNLPFSGFLQRGGVLIAIIVATIVSAGLGVADFSVVATVPWFDVPQLFAFGFPKFELTSSLVFVFLYFILMVETVGAWVAISHTTNTPLTKKRIDKGVVGEGLGCLIGAFVGSAPVTTYATNCGVISITKVYSRWAAVGAAVIIIVLSFVPKLMYIIASLPSTILWGVLIALCVSIIMSGLQSINRYKINERNFLIIGVPIALTIFVVMLPMDFVAGLPMFLSYLFSSAMCIGALAAIILNLILPKDKDESDDGSMDNLLEDVDVKEEVRDDPQSGA